MLIGNSTGKIEISKIKGAKGVDIKFTLGGGDPSRGFKYAGRTNTNK